MMYVFWSLSLLLLLIKTNHANPNLLSCDRLLTVGSNIMGGSATSDSTAFVSIQRNGVALTSGADFVPGETLTVTLSNAGSVQYMLQSSNGAIFVGGTCGNVRAYRGSGNNNPGIVNNIATLTMPSIGSGNVQVWAGWATGQNPLKITPSFILNDPITQGPSLKPVSIAPTLAPITPSPSFVSSITPTVTQTFAPSNPTFTSTLAPSTVPIDFPSNPRLLLSEFFIYLTITKVSSSSLDLTSQTTLIQAVAKVGKISSNSVKYKGSSSISSPSVKSTRSPSIARQPSKPTKREDEDEDDRRLSTDDPSFIMNVTLAVQTIYPASTSVSVMQADVTNIIALMTATALTSQLSSINIENEVFSKTSVVSAVRFSSLSISTTESFSPSLAPTRPTFLTTSKPSFKPISPNTIAQYLIYIVLKNLASSSLDIKSELSLIQAIAEICNINGDFLSFKKNNNLVKYTRMLQNSSPNPLYSLNVTISVRHPYGSSSSNSDILNDRNKLLSLLTTSDLLKKLIEFADANNAIAITKDVTIFAVGSSVISYTAPIIDTVSPTSSPVIASSPDNNSQQVNYQVAIGAAAGAVCGLFIILCFCFYCFGRKNASDDIDLNKNTDMDMQTSADGIETFVQSK